MGSLKKCDPLSIAINYLVRLIMGTSQENLVSAFAGESQANRKYLAFAKQAEKDGFNQIAKLFRAAAAAETIHAHPTLSEIISETAHVALDRTLHGWACMENLWTCYWSSPRLAAGKPGTQPKVGESWRSSDNLPNVKNYFSYCNSLAPLNPFRCAKRNLTGRANPAAPKMGISAWLQQACGETGDPLAEWDLSWVRQGECEESTRCAFSLLTILDFAPKKNPAKICGVFIYK